MESYHVIGLMSGTSLDGLDVALCRFAESGNSWNYSIIDARTYPYAEEWKEKLANAHFLDGFGLILLHKEYGKLLGNIVNSFLKDKKFKIDFIASHGHTIFHQPAKGITFQLGDGAALAATTGFTTISDFRSFDVALGGQGAPLVPIGDELLFFNYRYCLNLGGFANISYRENNSRIAFDICPVNIVCNSIARETGAEYDKDGETGRSGQLNRNLLEELNGLSFYSVLPPKSLGREWLENWFMPVIEKYQISRADKLRTMYEHIAIQIGNVTQRDEKGEILVTGGGAYNRFLIERIAGHVRHEIAIPSTRVVEFKEALIFAFLGILRYLNRVNCLRSVTGARFDNIGGIINLIS